MKAEDRARDLFLRLAAIDPEDGEGVAALIIGEIKNTETYIRGRCMEQVRAECGACSGTGHAGDDAECEYCGRPIAAIRQMII